MKRCGQLEEVSGRWQRYLDMRSYHSGRGTWGAEAASTSFLSWHLNTSQCLYRKDLYAHYGCVNAIEFSNEGDLLVSGGDDRRVLVWSVEEALTSRRRPRIMAGEHNSNIFCLSFDSSNTRIFSAGNDEQVIVHDLQTGKTVDVFLHREAVYGVSVSPVCDTIFASAGEDGRVLIYDMRGPLASEPMCLAWYHDAFHAVQFHPLEPRFVVTANSRDGVALWDLRKPRVPVLRYGEKRCAQSSMCARFNREGTQIIALRRRLPPVLYNTVSSKPVCQFDGDHYYNSCTMKSCCFAGDRDQYVLSGSDDFNLYMWKIPESGSTENFVSEAHMVLKGHRSIVNQVRFNPQNFIIASSGVEKIVKLWSGVALPGGEAGPEKSSAASANPMSRRVYTHAEYIALDVNHDYSHGSTDEDPRMMAFFDSLVQREVEGWTSNTDLSDDLDTRHQVNQDEDEEEGEDTETTTTTTTTATQSDDNDSDGRERLSVTQRLGTRQQGSRQHRAGQSQLHRSISNGRPKTTRPPEEKEEDEEDEDEEEDDEEEEEDDDEEDKLSGGSDWIMHLIAKKRAKLRLAKRARRRQKSELRRHHNTTTQHLLRSLTSTDNPPRRYLYRPEGEETREVSEDGPGLPTTVEDSEGPRHGSYRRRIMAPYTIMVVQQPNTHRPDQDSDDEPTSLLRPRASVEGKKRILWSSESDSGSEDGGVKRTRVGEGERRQQDQKRNGHIISEIIESSDSDSGDEGDGEGGGGGGGGSGGTGLESNRDLSSEASSTSIGVAGTLNDARLCERPARGEGSDLQLSSTVSDLVPITSVTTDDSGSLLFETERGSLGLDLPADMAVSAAPTAAVGPAIPHVPARKVLQNGSTTRSASTGSLEDGMPEVGLSGAPAVEEQASQAPTNCSATDGDRQEPVVQFRKCSRPPCSIRSYRRYKDL